MEVFRLNSQFLDYIKNDKTILEKDLLKGM